MSGFGAFPVASGRRTEPSPVTNSTRGLRPDFVRASISQIAQMVGEVPGVEIDSVQAKSRLDSWLTPGERALFNCFHLSKRRRDWLAGRLAAKDAVRQRFGIVGPDAFQRIEIVAIAAGLERGRPIYRVDGKKGEVSLSITHSQDIAMVALARSSHHRVGVDLEVIESRDRSFEDVVLSSREKRQLMALPLSSRNEVVTMIWVLKEALVKALGIGLRLSLPLISVILEADGKRPLARPFRLESPKIVNAHPLLRELFHLPMAVGLWKSGNTVAGWVVLSPSEES